MEAGTDTSAVGAGRNLLWYETAWAAIPLVMILFGGAIGGVSGYAAFVVNRQIMRKTESIFLRYVFTGLVSVGSYFVYVALASVILSFMNR